MPFDLAGEVPVRGRLFRAGPGVHVLVLVVHHIATDGWSAGVLARDIAAAYTARREGRAPGWAPLPVQYADYAHLAAGAARRGGRPRQPAVTAGRLVAGGAGRGAAGAGPAGHRPRPATASHRGHAVPLQVPAQVHQQLAALAREQGVTLFMVVQAALAALLCRLGAGDDIPVGTGVAGRTDAALDDLVGFFVNTLVLRTDVSGDPSFTVLLARVREFWLGALENQDVPFERLVDDLAPGRSLARHPLFQVLLTVQNNAPAVLDLPGLRASGFPAGAGAARFDLSVLLGEARGGPGGPGGLRGQVIAAADLFDPGTAAVLAERFTRVLAAVAADPGVPVHAVGVLDRAEREQLLQEWNDTAAEVPAATLPELVAAQAARTPDAVAVCGGGQWVSYRELLGRAGRLGGYLRDAGAGPETVVGLCLPPGPGMVTAVLGAWLAGAAYLPLDPGWPARRLAFALADSGAALVLGTGAVLGGLPAGRVPGIGLDDPAVAAAVAAASPAAAGPAPGGGWRT